MAELRFSEAEARALRAVLAAVTIRRRTGELGITHGLERFVSTQVVLKATQQTALDAAARKLGLGGGVRRAD